MTDHSAAAYRFVDGGFQLVLLVDLRAATETMAVVLFICVLGQPLVLAHLDGFTALGLHVSGSTRSAKTPKRGPARALKSSLGSSPASTYSDAAGSRASPSTSGPRRPAPPCRKSPPRPPSTPFLRATSALRCGASCTFILSEVFRGKYDFGGVHIFAIRYRSRCFGSAEKSPVCRAA